MGREMKEHLRFIVSLALLVAVLAASGCVGMAHSRQICCSDVPGKYYRATRVDMKVMKESPLAAPIVIVLDLPFALVIETLQAPFIMAGLVDPRPPQIDWRNIPDFQTNDFSETTQPREL
jgi:uncharacterized protein YceK